MATTKKTTNATTEVAKETSDVTPTEVSKKDVQADKQFEQDLKILKRIQTGIFADINSSVSILFDVLSKDKRSDEDTKKKPLNKWSIFHLDDQQKKELNRRYISTFYDYKNESNMLSVAWTKNLGLKAPYNLKKVIDEDFKNFTKNLLTKYNIIDDKNTIIDQDKWVKVKDLISLPIVPEVQKQKFKYQDLNKKDQPKLRKAKELDWNKIAINNKKWSPVTTTDLKQKLEKLTNKEFEVNPFDLNYFDVI